MKSEFIPTKTSCPDEDPRPEHMRNRPEYGDRVRNAFAACGQKSWYGLTGRHMFPKADLQTAVVDHHYLELPFTEYWVDRALQVNISVFSNICVKLVSTSSNI